MLVRLSVANLAVVDDASLELGPGLNAVTGETGAGKSLILGAVALLTGERAAGGLVRPGTPAARLEAVFEPREPERAEAALDALGLPPLEDGYLLLRRELSADGRSRAFVGDSQVRLATLKTLGERLVDIHGQAEGHELLRASRQREVLDEAGGHGAHRVRLRALLEEERALTTSIRDAERQREEIARQRELYEHQLREITDAALVPDEASTLRAERKVYLEAERIVAHANEVTSELSDDDGAALERLGRASTRLGQLSEIDERWRGALELVDSAHIATEEALRAVLDALDGFDFSPERRDEVEQRLDLIARLERKYARSVPDLILYAQTIRDALAGDEERARTTGALEAERARVRDEAAKVADALGAARAKAAKDLARRVMKELPDLGMKGARFQVHLEAEHDPGGWYEREGTPLRLGADGAERVDFRLSANAGQEPGSLARVASGGELSRVVLALKACLASAITTDVMIFDEIDAGVGGRTARAVAQRMAEIAAGRQVIAITHLAPVACAAAHHHLIEKRAARGTTRVHVRRLEESDRVAEVARMLGGKEDERAARAHAEEMLRAMRSDPAPAGGARAPHASKRRSIARKGAR